MHPVGHLYYPENLGPCMPKAESDFSREGETAMNFLGRGLLIAAVALLLGTLGFAQSDVVERDQYGTDVFQTADRDPFGSHVFPRADPQFMREAAQEAMANIHLAYLALQNAENEQVKSFALQILSDYSKAQRGLFSIANQQAVVLPSTLDSRDLDTFEGLSQLHGEAFDKAYMETMLNGNEMTTSRYEQEARKGDGWASHTLPTLQSNLKMAQKVALAVGVHPGVKEEQGAPSTNDKVSQEPSAKDGNETK